MTVTKPVPCSMYDIPGIQEWLDDMALQGFFLEDFSRQRDRAGFRMDDPKPVRYRLDPVGKPNRQEPDREELYAQMGWEYVCHIPRFYYIYCCADPEAPELYSDPQSLSIAMGGMIQREVKTSIFVTLFAIAGLLLLTLADLPRLIKELVLWESPRYLMISIWYPLVILALLPLLILDTRRLFKIRDTLAQGLPLKAKKRWNRPRFWTWYVPVYLTIFLLPRLIVPDVGWDVGSLDELALSHTWPDMVQTEALGPKPLEMEPHTDGYATENSSWLAPVQEERSTSYYVRFPSDTVPRSSDYWTDVRYVQARFPKAAGLVFQVELEDAEYYLSRQFRWRASSAQINGYTGFEPLDWPGVDRLEVARYQRGVQDSWTAAVLRGTDILVVTYRGQAQPEDCLGLFLEALN